MNKHFVILEDGTKATRNSENRIYTHAIAISPLDLEVGIEQKMAQIKTQEEWKADVLNDLANIKEFGVQIVAGEPSFGGTVWAEFYTNGKRIWLDGIHKFGEITEAEAVEKAIAKAEAYLAHCESRIAKMYDEIADAKDKGQWGTWGIATWCGRLDLARKQLDRFSGRKGETAIIVEVERVGA